MRRFIRETCAPTTLGSFALLSTVVSSDTLLHQHSPLASILLANTARFSHAFCHRGLAYLHDVARSLGFFIAISCGSLAATRRARFPSICCRFRHFPLHATIPAYFFFFRFKPRFPRSPFEPFLIALLASSPISVFSQIDLPQDAGGLLI